MSSAPEFMTPVSWTRPGFTLNPDNPVFLPGGHEKGVRQVIDSPFVQSQLATYFPQTLKSSKAAKAAVAICHGVL
jgi:hypothetical protein